MEAYFYVIKGDIGPLTLLYATQDRAWTRRKQMSFNFQNQLENQLGEGNKDFPLSGSLRLVVSVYHLVNKMSRDQMRKLDLDPYAALPEEKLIVWRYGPILDYILSGILYVHPSQVVSFSVKKLYDIEPRVEIAVHRE